MGSQEEREPDRRRLQTFLFVCKLTVWLDLAGHYFSFFFFSFSERKRRKKKHERKVCPGQIPFLSPKYSSSWERNVHRNKRKYRWPRRPNDISLFCGPDATSVRRLAIGSSVLSESLH